jgi:hypothetical protein
MTLLVKRRPQPSLGRSAPPGSSKSLVRDGVDTLDADVAEVGHGRELVEDGR